MVKLADKNFKTAIMSSLITYIFKNKYSKRNEN